MWWAGLKATLGQRINLEVTGCGLGILSKDKHLAIPHVSVPVSVCEQCKSLSGDNVAVFSNSAGLTEFDCDGEKARAVEDAIGINVIRHRTKKPTESVEEIEQHFGCESSSLVMVGDRLFTDIVYGNKNGFLTILTEPLSLAEESLIVRQVRSLEVALVNRWSESGLKMNSQSQSKFYGVCKRCTNLIPRTNPHYLFIIFTENDVDRIGYKFVKEFETNSSIVDK